jgi:3-oxoacyl-(acyl-carrier-protein) synthase
MSRVLVRGRGLVCALGAGEEALWRGLLGGESAMATCPELLPQVLPAPSWRVGQVPATALGAGPEPVSRCLALLREAVRQLRDGPGWPTPVAGGSGRRPRLGLCIGTTQGEVRRWEAEQIALERDNSMQPAEPALSGPPQALAEELDADGPVSTVSMACASGTAAVGLAASWIRDGLCELAVAGGADVLSPMVQAGFAALRALDPERPRPFDRRRAGLGIGEGAALLLLGASDRPPAGSLEVLGWGFSSDAHHLTGPAPEGRGLARAVKAALEEASLPAEAVEAVNAHGTGTVFNDLMEAKALRLVFGDRAASLPVDGIKGAIGHCMGAAGAIEAVLCAGVLERGLLPPTCGLEELDPAIALEGLVRGEARPGNYRVVLSTSSGFGGINAALLLGRS